CKAGWDWHDGLCYKCHCKSSSMATWSRAQQTCESEGGNLVSIHDSTQNLLVRKIKPDYKLMWIRLNDRDAEGQYKWSDGSEVGFTPWDFGEPVNVTGLED
ncbi:predicted protein, partial [Nematostella vectensis]